MSGIYVPHEDPKTADECMENLFALLQQGPAVTHADDCPGNEEGLDSCECWVASFAAARAHLVRREGRRS